MKLVEVRNVFVSILPTDTFHYAATSESSQYIIWAEEGQSDALHADDEMQDQIIEGTVDLFTKLEYDPLFNQIQEAMNNSDMVWRWNSTQYEEETGYIHHEWIWEVDNSVG